MSELPTEHELFPDALYRSPRTGEMVRGDRIAGGTDWVRLAPVAVYKPAPTEPTGLGAVVVDGHDWVWVSHGSFGWFSTTGGRKGVWDDFPRPVEIRSRGVTL